MPPLAVGATAVIVTATEPTPVDGTAPPPAIRTVMPCPPRTAPLWLPAAPVRVSTTRDCFDSATYVPPGTAAAAGTAATTPSPAATSVTAAGNASRIGLLM